MYAGHESLARHALLPYRSPSGSSSGSQSAASRITVNTAASSSTPSSAREPDSRWSSKIPRTPVESLPDEVSVAGVPGGLFNQVQQHPAHVAVDDVRPCAGVVELHGVNDLPRPRCCLLVASHPLLDRVSVVDEEVLVWDRGLVLRPPTSEGAPSDDALKPSVTPPSA